MQRKTESDYTLMGKRRNVRWVGTELPPDVLSLTKWQCQRGHVFEMRYANLGAGRECPMCSRYWRRRMEDYRRTGESHGLIFVGRKLPRNTRVPTLWALPDGRILQLSSRSLEMRTRRVDSLSAGELAELTVPSLDAPEIAEDLADFDLEEDEAADALGAEIWVDE